MIRDKASEDSTSVRRDSWIIGYLNYGLVSTGYQHRQLEAQDVDIILMISDVFLCRESLIIEKAFASLGQRICIYPARQHRSVTGPNCPGRSGLGTFRVISPPSAVSKTSSDQGFKIMSISDMDLVGLLPLPSATKNRRLSSHFLLASADFWDF